ncbi:hypothetical protein V8E55_001246 [Tylopilus felleus]
MMIDFFSKLKKGTDIVESADYLGSDYPFLCKDDECLDPEGLFCSAFLLELIARTHILITASDFVEIPGWDLRAVAAGKHGAGVIAIAAAALERAINLIAQRIIIVENVLAEWGANTDSRNKIKLPKTTNPLTGRESSGPYQFSAANWAVDTAAYKESIKNRNALFICATFAAAQAFRHPKNGSSDNAPNPCALLCKAIISLLYWLFRVLKTLLEPFP